MTKEELKRAFIEAVDDCAPALITWSDYPEGWRDTPCPKCGEIIEVADNGCVRCPFCGEKICGQDL